MQLRHDVRYAVTEFSVHVCPNDTTFATCASNARNHKSTLSFRFPFARKKTGGQCFDGNSHQDGYCEVRFRTHTSVNKP